MRLGAYLLLMFSIVLVFYFMGYKSAGLTAFFGPQGTGDSILDANGAIDIPNFLKIMVDGAAQPGSVVTSILLIAAAAITTLVAGYAAIYIIPIAIVILLMNYLVFPFSYVADPSTPTIISVPVIIFLNVLTIITIWGAIRTGGNG